MVEDGNSLTVWLSILYRVGSRFLSSSCSLIYDLKMFLIKLTIDEIPSGSALTDLVSLIVIFSSLISF